MSTLRHLSLGAVLACVPLGAGAQTMQNPQDVAQAVQKAAQNLVPPGAQLHVGTVKGASYMPTCTTPLSVSLSGAAPYEQATVQCAAPRWTLYVAVTVEQSETVVVAAKPLTAGQNLTADDLMLKRLPIQAFAGRQIFTTPAELVGDNILMSLSAGMMISQNIVQSPLIVKAGQMVSVHVYSGGVELSLDAVAEQDGHIGQTILLTNPISHRRFSAEVTAEGVELRL